MNLKELSELRRRWRPEKSAVSRIYGCFVNSNKEIISDLDEALGRMPQEEAEKYLALLKKALSGTLGKNLIDIVFSTQQVMNSEEHRLLTALRASELKDHDVRQAFYQKVISSLDLGESRYLILLAHDAYDVPHRGKDGEVQPDASEEVFSYIVCSICPIKEGKLELSYFPGDNEFHCTALQTAAAPELGFLFPAFDDRTANIYNALFYSRKPDELHQEFIDAVFHTEPPMSAAEQKEAFQAALSASLGEACSVDVVQAIHEQLSTKIEEHKQNKNPELLTISVDEICALLQDCGIAREHISAFRDQCSEQFGVGAVLNPVNLIDANRVQIKTAQASVTVDPEHSYLVKTKLLNGRRYIMLPADDGVEFNGFAVGTSTEDSGM